MTFNLARALGASTAALSVEYLGIPASFGINRQAQELAGRSVSHLRSSIELLRRRRATFVVAGPVGGTRRRMSRRCSCSAVGSLPSR